MSPDEYITIKEFCAMAPGGRHRQWYYDNRKEPGFPQSVLLGGRVYLVKAECEAYFDGLLKHRGRTARRRAGRPPKAKEPAEEAGSDLWWESAEAQALAFGGRVDYDPVTPPAPPLSA